MRLTIFSRLIIVYCLIIILVMAVSAFAILKLHEFNAGTRHILSVDNRILEYEENLSRLILSQVRYEKKYLITRDPSFYDQVLAARTEFNKDLDEVRAIVDTPAKKELAEKLKTAYEKYISLIEEEVNQVKAKRPYPQKWYEQEKEEATAGILGDLETLEDHSRKDIYRRMKMLREGGDTARKLAIIMSSVAFFFVIGTSFLITRSITSPLKLLMGQTKEISSGVFKCDLKISSPPEIAELARAFNSMCDKLTVVDKMKSDFFSTMSHELRTPLTSIREGNESPPGWDRRHHYGEAEEAPGDHLRREQPPDRTGQFPVGPFEDGGRDDDLQDGTDDPGTAHRAGNNRDRASC